MVGSTMGLVVLGVALTIFAGPLFQVAGQSADAMLDRSAYIQAVLGQQAPVPNLVLNGGSTPNGSSPSGGGK
jgi:multicomponent Na+:H+ antiporter subunit D